MLPLRELGGATGDATGDDAPVRPLVHEGERR